MSMNSQREILMIIVVIVISCFYSKTQVLEKISPLKKMKINKKDKSNSKTKNANNKFHKKYKAYYNFTNSHIPTIQNTNIYHNYNTT